LLASFFVSSIPIGSNRNGKGPLFPFSKGTKKLSVYHPVTSQMKVYRILVRDSLSKRWFIILVVFPESWLGGKTQHRPRCGARTMRNSMPKKRRSRWHCGMHERREAVGLFLDLGAEQIIYSN